MIPARAFLFLLATGCAFPPEGTGGKRPQIGHFYCAVNTTSQRATIYAEGRFTAEQLGRKGDATIYRMIEVQRAQPGERKCFRWPFVSRAGRIVMVAGTDTLWGAWMDPWP